MTTLQGPLTTVKKYSHTENAFLPKTVTVPLSQEKNCVCRCLVKPGDFINEGDIIARPSAVEGFKGVIHSPIPGKVLDIISTYCPNGNLENAVRIRLQGSFSYLGKQISKKDWTDFSSSALISKISEYGIINTFLTYEPLSLGDQLKNQLKKKNRKLIIRLYDEDKMRISDSLYTKFFLEEIIVGAKITAKALEADNVIFAVDDGLDKSIIEKISAVENSQILQINANKYPSGFKRELRIYFNKMFKKTSGISISENDLFVDSCTMFEVYKGIVNGIPSISKYIHVSGPCLKTEAFLNIKLGFSIKDIVAQMGGFVKQPALIVINGLICGYTIGSLDIPVTKYVKSIEFLTEFRTTDYHTYSCVNCGNCREICPVKISPDILYTHMTKRRNISENFINSSLLCTECGLCNTVCPSRLPLCQTISVLNEQLKEKQNEKQ